MNILARIKVVLTAFVTYAILAMSALTVVSEQLPSVAGTLAKVVGVLATAVLIIRRVTPVLDDERGLL